MYKLAEQKLLKEIEKLKKEFEPKNEELNEIKAKLENIAKYDDLIYNNFNYAPMGILGLIIGSICSIGVIAIIIHFLNTSAFNVPLVLLGIGVGGFGGIFFYGAKVLLSDLKPNYKNIKELKQKGVKKDKKNQNVLLAKEKKLEDEKKRNQDKINEINIVLEYIDFYKATKDDLFFQADTKEDYDLAIEKKENYEQLFDEDLEEKIDYSSIYFESIPSEITLPDEMSLRKIYK